MYFFPCTFFQEVFFSKTVQVVLAISCAGQCSGQWWWSARAEGLVVKAETTALCLWPHLASVLGLITSLRHYIKAVLVFAWHSYDLYCCCFWEMLVMCVSVCQSLNPRPPTRSKTTTTPAPPSMLLGLFFHSKSSVVATQCCGQG